MKQRRLRLYWRIMMILVGFAILSGSLLPPGDGPGLLPDKLVHVLAYGVWSALAAISPRPVKRRLLYLAVILLTGLAIESIQPFVGREGSLADLAANGLGILLGALSAACLKTYISKQARTA